jgi:chromate transport protein ChrA
VSETNLRPRSSVSAGAYLRCTSFGGPIARISVIFATQSVVRRWLDDATFTDIVGLCQPAGLGQSIEISFSVTSQKAPFSCCTYNGLRW